MLLYNRCIFFLGFISWVYIPKCFEMQAIKPNEHQERKCNDCREARQQRQVSLRYSKLTSACCQKNKQQVSELGIVPRWSWIMSAGIHKNRTGQYSIYTGKCLGKYHHEFRIFSTKVSTKSGRICLHFSHRQRGHPQQA